jgi:hypothetical protein
MTTDTNQAEEQARAQLSSICGMVAALLVDYDRIEELENLDETERKLEENEELEQLKAQAGQYTSEDEARDAIMEDPLSVEVGISDYFAPGDTPKPDEYCILLCTGGPAVRIVGDLDEHGEPSRPRLEYQDWGTPWTELVNHSERAALQTYTEQFSFGE